MRSGWTRDAALAQMRRLRRGAVGGLRAGLDFLVPPLCPLCRTPVSCQGLLCSACFGRIGFVSAPLCACCGVPFSAAVAGDHCPGCAERRPAFTTARAALRYDAQSRRLILPLKHADRLEFAPVLGAMMLRAGAALLPRADLLVPVPLHRRRLFHRRYNQASVLALWLGRHAKRPVVADGLVRVRETAPLDEKTAEARAAEVQDAFAVRPNRLRRIAGARVLLIDDVMTSGATAEQCARTLLRAGAASVDVLVAARVPDPRLS